LGDPSGDPISNEGLMLDAPSSCESGWEGGGDGQSSQAPRTPARSIFASFLRMIAGR